MSGATSRLALYLPGGGSTGSYGADEVADIDKINANFVKLDAEAGAKFGTTKASLPSGTTYGQMGYASTDKITYRWSGTAWIPWDSDWTGYSSTWTGITAGEANGQYRYVCGKLKLEQSMNASSAASGVITASLPVAARQTALTSNTNSQSGTWANGRANGYVGGNDYDFAIAFSGANAIGFRIPNATSRIVESVGNSVPVAWNNTAQLRFVIEYDVA